MRSAMFLAFLILACWNSQARSAGERAIGAESREGRIPAASELNTRDPEVIRRAYRYPKIDATRALSGDALIRALRQGGFVLYMRHTQTGTVTPDCTQSNLTPAGERDARFVGESIRALRIPIDRVLSSPVCRVFDTARLLGLGDAEATLDLSNQPAAVANLEQARLKQLLATPAPGKNRMLVSHLQHGKAEQDRLALDFGEVIVLKPDGKSMFDAVARIRADDWHDLIAFAK